MKKRALSIVLGSGMLALVGSGCMEMESERRAQRPALPEATAVKTPTRTPITAAMVNEKNAGEMARMLEDELNGKQ